MNKLCADVSYRSLKKHGEELCGDKVYVVQADDSTIVILADGLGSGVKANILATLTSKIAGDMLRHGAAIEDVVQTIAATLPVCKVRGIAYSTFSIFQVFDTGMAHLVEYDNPATFRFHHGTCVPLDMTTRVIHNKAIRETFLKVDPSDTFLMLSDGVIHAGIGGVLNLGWQWNNVAEYTEKILRKVSSASDIADLLSTTCNHLYYMEPGDDTTVVAVNFRHSSPVSILVGPPSDPANDADVVRQWFQADGEKIVCGGTTANIVSQVLGRPIRVEMPEVFNKDVPPYSQIDGINLVTEGVLTLRAALLRLKGMSSKEGFRESLDGGDAAERLIKILLASTEVHFYVGTAINPAHQNPDFPPDLNIKLRIIREINDELHRLEKKSDMRLF